MKQPQDQPEEAEEDCCDPGDTLMNLSDFNILDPADGGFGENLFVCPGATSGVSRAVHLARLHAGWSVCDQCEWRRHTEGLSEHAVDEIQRIRHFRREGLERSEFGVRGPWLNVLDRCLAERLAEVFCVCLQRSCCSAAERTEVVPADTESRREPLRSIILGYDARAFSQDLFAGVATAVSRLGFPVHDAGRTTAAALHEAIRRTPGVLGGLLVTGAGCPTAWAGLDVFNAAGESVPVVWKDFGIRLFQTADENAAGSAGTRPVISRLQLDTRDLPETGRRLSRSSGTVSALDTETSYRRWLSTWYVGTSGRSLVIVSDDPLVRQRVQWLNDQGAAELVLRNRQSVEPAAAAIQLLVEDDDRFFVIQDAEGRIYPADLLAQRLNRLLGSGFGHLTVHADAVTGRIWLTDTVLPAAGAIRGSAAERIEDVLAFGGLLLRLNVGGRLLV